MMWWCVLERQKKSGKRKWENDPPLGTFMIHIDTLSYHNKFYRKCIKEKYLPIKCPYNIFTHTHSLSKIIHYAIGMKKREKSQACWCCFMLKYHHRLHMDRLVEIIVIIIIAVGKDVKYFHSF